MFCLFILLIAFLSFPACAPVQFEKKPEARPAQVLTPQNIPPNSPVVVTDRAAQNPVRLPAYDSGYMTEMYFVPATCAGQTFYIDYSYFTNLQSSCARGDGTYEFNWRGDSRGYY